MQQEEQEAEHGGAVQWWVRSFTRGTEFSWMTPPRGGPVLLPVQCTVQKKVRDMRRRGGDVCVALHEAESRATGCDAHSEVTAFFLSLQWEEIILPSPLLVSMRLEFLFLLPPPSVEVESAPHIIV